MNRMKCFFLSICLVSALVACGVNKKTEEVNVIYEDNIMPEKKIMKQLCFARRWILYITTHFME